MSANYMSYDNAMGKLDGLSNQYTELDNSLNEELNRQKLLQSENTGEKGYQKSIDLGKQGAKQIAGEAVTQAQTAARQSGMSRAAAATMGAQQAANQYASNFNTQQGQAANQLQNELASQQNVIAGKQQQIQNVDTRKAGQLSEAQQHIAGTTQKYQNQMAAIGAGANVTGQVVGGIIKAAAASDKDLKHIHCKNDAEKIIELMDKINSYTFKYTEEAQEIEKEHGADDDVHVGIVAQELEKNPITESAVEIDDKGNRVVDTNEMTMINTSIISALCKEVKELKDMVWKISPYNEKGETKEEAHEEHDDVINDGAVIEDKPKFKFGFMKEE